MARHCRRVTRRCKSAACSAALAVAFVDADLRKHALGLLPVAEDKANGYRIRADNGKRKAKTTEQAPLYKCRRLSLSAAQRLQLACQQGIHFLSAKLHGEQRHGKYIALAFAA